MSLSPLYLGETSDLHVSTAFWPPFQFPETWPSPGKVRRFSGIPLHTLTGRWGVNPPLAAPVDGAFRPLSRNLFQCASTVEPLKLACKRNSSVRVSRRAVLTTLSHWSSRAARGPVTHAKPVYGTARVAESGSTGPAQCMCLGLALAGHRGTAEPPERLRAPLLGRHKSSLRFGAQRGAAPTPLGTDSTVQNELISSSISIPDKGCFHSSLALLLWYRSCATVFSLGRNAPPLFSQHSQADLLGMGLPIMTGSLSGHRTETFCGPPDGELPLQFPD